MAKIIAIDFETAPITAEAPLPRPICLACYDGNSSQIYVGHEKMHEFLMTTLAFSDVQIVAHNAKFEIGIIYNYFPELQGRLWEMMKEGKWHCTILREIHLDNIRPLKERGSFYGLAHLVLKYFLKDISVTKGEDAWRLRYEELENIPLTQWPQEAIQYVLDDAYWAYELFHIQNVSTNDTLGIQADFVLSAMGSRGFEIDQSRVGVLDKEVEEYLMPRYKSLLDSGFVSITPKGKFKKLMKSFREHIKETVTNYRLTDKGEVETGVEALSTYLPQTDVLRTFAEIAEIEKVNSAFVPALKSANGIPLRSNYTLRAKSGRTTSTSSKLYPSVNIQQMPREVRHVTYDVRGCFKARDGYKLVAIDYAGIELCSTANQLYKLLGESQMRNYLNEGDEPADLHSRLAAKIMSMERGEEVSYEEFKKRKKEPEFARYRQLCKAINLGFPGGIGYDVMRTQLYANGVILPYDIIGQNITSEDDANKIVGYLTREYGINDIRVKRLTKTNWAVVKDPLVAFKKQFLKLYPELEIFLKENHKLFLNGQSTMTKNDFGEWEEEELYDYKVHGHERRNCTYTALCNGYLMQTPVAQGTKQVLVDLTKKYISSDDVHLLAFIHDEVVLEVKNNTAMQNTIDEVADIMLKGMKKVLPDVRIAVEASVMDYWSKSQHEFEKVYFC